MARIGSTFIKEDLVLYIDAANSKCFKSGDTTCKNLISGGLLTGANGNPGTGTHTPDPSNFPSYNSDFGGIFDFTGGILGKGMNVEEDLGTSTELTICTWLNTPSTNQQYISDGRNNGGQWFIANYTGYGVNYTNALRYAPNTDFTNKWAHMTATSNASGSKLYFNATEVSSYTTQASVDEDLGKNFRIGARYLTAAGNTQYLGYIGLFMIYKRALTPAEIKQNYRTTNRFIVP